MKRPALAMMFGVSLLALGGCSYESADYGPYGYEARTYSADPGRCGLSGDCSRGFYDSAGWWHDRYW
jgi:hypothetical protein